MCATDFIIYTAFYFYQQKNIVNNNFYQHYFWFILIFEKIVITTCFFCLPIKPSFCFRDEQRKFNYWDIFRKDVSAQRVTRKSSLSDKIFKGLKLFVYVILFLLVFGGAIVSRAALQILTDQLYLERQTNYTVCVYPMKLW